MSELILWDVYTVLPTTDPITGVGFRGRVRKYCVENECNVLLENAVDQDGCVRFAVLTGTDASHIIEYINSIVPTATVDLSERAVTNPVLSKLKVNNVARYE